MDGAPKRHALTLIVIIKECESLRDPPPPPPSLSAVVVEN